MYICKTCIEEICGVGSYVRWYSQRDISTLEVVIDRCGGNCNRIAMCYKITMAELNEIADRAKEIKYTGIEPTESQKFIDKWLSEYMQMLFNTIDKDQAVKLRIAGAPTSFAPLLSKIYAAYFSEPEKVPDSKETFVKHWLGIWHDESTTITDLLERIYD